ncbi:histidine kinase, partial [bacterium]|nr:histidine kinase [candidate division CSSED10-310 bacterium]
VRALIEENEDHAQAMVTELSEFLRYSLMNEDHEDIPLKYEIEALRHYFSIEKKRYEDNLDVKFEIQPEAENYPVISFLIHPLAENAIKYGMKTSRMPLQIRVLAKVQNKHLKVSVCNTGSWLSSEENGFSHLSTGTGLENVKNRLENAFPRQYHLDVVQEGQTVTVLMDIYRN